MVQSAPLTDDGMLTGLRDLVADSMTSIDDFAIAKQKRLLTDSLYTSLRGQSFLIEANIGILHSHGQPLVVPDILLSLDVSDDWWDRRNYPYFLWQFGKPPDVTIEIVSDRNGEELGQKLALYERMRVSYYVVYDPHALLGETLLYIFELRGKCFFEIAKVDRSSESVWLDQVGLGLVLWSGNIENCEGQWLRWCDNDGLVLPTGYELAQQEYLTRDENEKRADLAESQLRQANQRTERAKKWATRLADQLRALGVDPDTL